MLPKRICGLFAQQCCCSSVGQHQGAQTQLYWRDSQSERTLYDRYDRVDLRMLNTDSYRWFSAASVFECFESSIVTLLSSPVRDTRVMYLSYHFDMQAQAYRSPVATLLCWFLPTTWVTFRGERRNPDFLCARQRPLGLKNRKARGEGFLLQLSALPGAVTVSCSEWWQRCHHKKQ